MDKAEISPGSREDVSDVYQLCRADGWNCLQEDIDMGFLTCPAALQLARVDGTLIGACMGTAVNEEQGFINLLLVEEQYRGKGIGGDLLTRCLHALGNRNVTLFTAQNSLNFYQKRGFKTGDDPCKIYFKRFIPNKTALQAVKETGSSEVRLVPLESVSVQSINEYDVGINLIDRKSWIQDALEKYQGVAAMDSNNKIHGYGILRLTHGVYSFSPLLADNPSVARTLTDHMLQMMPDGAPLEVTVYEENPDAVALVKMIGLPDDTEPGGFQVFTKKRFVIPTHRVYFVMQGDFFA